MKAILSGIMLCLALSTVAPARAQDRSLAELYLAEPRPFDALFDGGVELARYPILALREDGRFAVYLLQSHCELFDEAGRSIDEGGRTDPERRRELCERAAAVSEPDLGALNPRSTALR